MSDSLESLLRIDKEKAEAAVEVLVSAFRNYSLLRYYFPDESQRAKVSHFFLSFVVYSGIKYGEVYAPSLNLEGIAVWIPSKNYPLTFWKMLRSVPLSTIFNFGRYVGSKMRRFGEHLDNVHERLAPFNHWFLQTIGVAPSFHGKGYASRLLRPMLTRIDEEGLPCYLETIDNKNVSIYEHFGFKVIDKSTVAETKFTNWAMLREAPPTT